MAKYTMLLKDYLAAGFSLPPVLINISQDLYDNGAAFTEQFIARNELKEIGCETPDAFYSLVNAIGLQQSIYSSKGAVAEAKRVFERGTTDKTVVDSLTADKTTFDKGKATRTTKNYELPLVSPTGEFLDDTRVRTAQKDEAASDTDTTDSTSHTGGTTTRTYTDNSPEYSDKIYQAYMRDAELRERILKAFDKAFLGVW